MGTCRSDLLRLMLGIFLLPATLVAISPEKREIDGATYHILVVPPESVRVLWRGADGDPLHTFPAAVRHLLARGETPAVLMNGGIFEPGGIPSGLLVQEGVELRPLNLREGRGNFFLKPNGVFLIDETGARVIASEEYLSLSLRPIHAVQSGPLLLREGELHPAFRENSSSRLHRNGVGIDKRGNVVFVMTEFRSPKFPNLFEFARAFSLLGCADALFLDGDLSQMKSGESVGDPSNHFGSIIAVVSEVAKPVRGDSP